MDQSSSLAHTAVLIFIVLAPFLNLGLWILKTRYNDRLARRRLLEVDAIRRASAPDERRKARRQALDKMIVNAALDDQYEEGLARLEE